MDRNQNIRVITQCVFYPDRVVILNDEIRKEPDMEDKMFTLYDYVIYNKTEGVALVRGEINVRQNVGLIVCEQVAVKHADLLSKNKDKFESGEVVILTRPFC